MKFGDREAQVYMATSRAQYVTIPEGATTIPDSLEDFTVLEGAAALPVFEAATHIANFGPSENGEGNSWKIKPRGGDETLVEIPSSEMPETPVGIIMLLLQQLIQTTSDKRVTLVIK